MRDLLARLAGRPADPEPAPALELAPVPTSEQLLVDVGAIESRIVAEAACSCTRTEFSRSI